MKIFSTKPLTIKRAYEAIRINFISSYDPFPAIHDAEIIPLPHQISAVYHDMLPRYPLRYLLADDPGSGKTIMTGLLIKELIIRRKINNCLIVCPGSLAEQWQNELLSKFHMHFDFLNDDINNKFYIAKLDTLSRNDKLKNKIKSINWDLIIIDEAHKLSASFGTTKINYTKRFRLGQLLSSITENFLLLTATPHNGKTKDFMLFLSLIDKDRFSTNYPAEQKDISFVMRRLIKEDLINFDGSKLFPQRTAYTVNYSLSDLESELYKQVTNYVCNEFNIADKLSGKRKNTVGFALTVLQRRLASSPEAIFQSLKRRHDRLQQKLFDSQNIFGDDDFDEDDYTSKQLEEAENFAVDYISAASSTFELQEEINILANLTQKAEQVRNSGKDRKWQELSKLLQEDNLMFSSDGKREKLIIFTEHRDTLNYLYDKIINLLGNNSEAVVKIHGGINQSQRRKIEEEFRNNDNVIILIATDAAGEGINLQSSHLMVNYDLPWNPNRLEQRFGRIHRIGQKKNCYLWNLVAENTREGQVFQRLLSKIEEEKKVLGGKVFDILGKITFNNKSLRELLIEAVRYENTRINLSHNDIVSLINQYSLTDDKISHSQAVSIKQNMQRSDPNKLQPDYISSFFIEAFRELGGSIHPRENNSWEITRVPHEILSFSDKISSRYHRINFTRDIIPGSDLLNAVVNSILTKYSNEIRNGTIFIDDNDYSQNLRFLFCIQHFIFDGTGKELSKHVNFIELLADNYTFIDSGTAPYLNYRAPENNELSTALNLFDGKNNYLPHARKFAVNHIIPANIDKEKKIRLPLINAAELTITQTLSREIDYSLSKADTLLKNGDTEAANLEYRRADELKQNMYQRINNLHSQKNIYSLPPVIISTSLIVPKGLLDKDKIINTQSTEYMAMNAVMELEKKLGFSPIDVSSKKCGYDIESRNNDSVKFIEVKGHVKSSKNVTVTANEINTAVNSPDEFILAIVETDGNNSHIVYLKNSFKHHVDMAVSSISYDINKLIHISDLIYED